MMPRMWRARTTPRGTQKNVKIVQTTTNVTYMSFQRKSLDSHLDVLADSHMLHEVGYTIAKTGQMFKISNGDVNDRFDINYPHGALLAAERNQLLTGSVLAEVHCAYIYAVHITVVRMYIRVT